MSTTVVDIPMDPLMDVILKTVRQHPKQMMTDREIGFVVTSATQDERVKAVNSLMSSGHLQLFKDGNQVLFKAVDDDTAKKFRGLGPNERLVYQLIEDSGNMGVWSRIIRLRSRLQQATIAKILRLLEGRSLIKSIKSVASKNKKVYMLFDVEPSREVTGGAWYSGTEFDSEFIDILCQHCNNIVSRMGTATLKQVYDTVAQSGLLRVELRLEDLEVILQTLVHDDLIEVIPSAGADADSWVSAAASQDKTFRAVSYSTRPDSALTGFPCGTCPVVDECTPTGAVSPNNCIYMDDFLTF